MLNINSSDVIEMLLLDNELCKEGCINKAVIGDILNLLISHGEIKDKKYRYNTSKRETFCFNYVNIFGLDISKLLIYKKYEQILDVSFIISNLTFLNFLDKYGVNWVEIKEEFDMTYCQIVTLLGLLHEIGHMKNMKNLTDRDLKEYRVSLSMIEMLEDSEKDMHYREIKEEAIADKFACDMMLKYTHELTDIVKGYIK